LFLLFSNTPVPSKWVMAPPVVLEELPSQAEEAAPCHIA
jgi:hypothetical protein